MRWCDIDVINKGLMRQVFSLEKNLPLMIRFVAWCVDRRQINILLKLINGFVQFLHLVNMKLFCSPSSFLFIYMPQCYTDFIT